MLGVCCHFLDPGPDETSGLSVIVHLHKYLRDPTPKKGRAGNGESARRKRSKGQSRRLRTRIPPDSTARTVRCSAGSGYRAAKGNTETESCQNTTDNHLRKRKGENGKEQEGVASRHVAKAQDQVNVGADPRIPQLQRFSARAYRINRRIRLRRMDD